MVDPAFFCAAEPQFKTLTLSGRGEESSSLTRLGARQTSTFVSKNVAKILQSHLSPRLKDLLEIAAYVYTADWSTQRGTRWTDDDSTEPWERDFSFVIPVREPMFWNLVSSQLTELLHFLSDDRYSFQFVPLTQEHFGQQEYLEFGDKDDWPF